MKIKKRNGFTLVELLVTIALMLTILGIAIVSVVNVNNNKKQEAWNLVKEQIETAAEDYFTANEYLFEGLTDDQNSNAQISVGTLVKEDYLNKVTNPVTGEEISSCSIVNVKKRKGALTATFDEETINSELTECDDTKAIIISDVPKKDIPLPDFDVSYFKDSNCSSSVSADSNTGWFNINKLGEDKPLYIKVSPKEGSKVSNVEVSVGENVIQSYNKLDDGAYCVQLADEGDISYDVTAYGPGGNKTIGSSYQKDTIRPTFTYTLGYKLFNIWGAVRNEYGICDEDVGYQTISGVRCKTTVDGASVIWDNSYNPDGYKLSNGDFSIYQVQILFPDKQFVMNKDTVSVLLNNGEIDGSCTYSSSDGIGRVYCGSLSNPLNTSKVEVVFKGATLDKLNGNTEKNIVGLDGGGINLYIKNNSTNNTLKNGDTLPIQKIYYNVLRLNPICVDGDGSGCNNSKETRKVCINSKDSDCHSYKEGQFTFHYNDHNSVVDGEISAFGEGNFYFYRSDNAGNQSYFIIDTNGKLGEGL